MNNKSFQVEVANLANELRAATVKLEAERDRLQAAGEQSAKLDGWIDQCEQAECCYREIAAALGEATTEEHMEQIQWAYNEAQPVMEQLATELANLPIFAVAE